MFYGETIQTGASNVCPDCSVELEVHLMQSTAGLYFGTECECGPYSRESGYFASKFEALTSLLA